MPIYQNLDIIRIHNPEYVLILAGDHIYKMDYGPMIAQHVENGADMTVGCLEVDLEAARAFGVMTTDAGRAGPRIQRKTGIPAPMPGSDDTALASMGIYVFNTRFLFEQLIKDADNPIPAMISDMTSFPAIIQALPGVYLPVSRCANRPAGLLAGCRYSGCFLGDQSGADWCDTRTQPV